MLRLIRMPPEQFSIFIEQTIKTFSQDKARAEGISSEAATRIALRQLSEILPDGQETPGHFFFLIQQKASDQVIGHLWVGLKKHQERKRAFLYDFWINPRFQGLGFGKESLRLLEQYAQSLEVEKLELHVFSTNSRAISLYEKLGYVRSKNGVHEFEMEKYLD